MLTKFTASNGSICLIDPSKITMVYKNIDDRGSDGKGYKVYLNDSSWIVVLETPEQILEMLEKL